MSMVFLFCAMIGGTILVCQVVLTLVGLGHHEFAVEHDGSHDPGGADAEHPNVNWFFGVLTFRTLVAAVTFFGLAGMAAHAAELGLPSQLAAAVVAGGGAMLAVHRIMQLFFRLGEDGTVRIGRAVGVEGTVYVPIPAGNAGPGKVQLKLQGRLMEYEAATDHGEALRTGAKVVVVGIVGANTLAVRPLPETSSVAVRD